jgi:pimeloyl-ACP methyl ester carboxylesterase
MKKRSRILSITAGSIVGALLLAAGVGASVQAMASSIEAGDLPEYGTLVDVEGRDMNVVVTGSGEQTIVLLPGFGTAAPAIDFAPVTRELAADYRVVVVEPFGYGLSDATDVPRTTENIVTEVHTAVQSLGIETYVLGGHSIAGLYALEYVERYRDEVTAFVGIDTSVPDQPGMDAEFPIGLFAAIRNLGIARALSLLPSDAYGDAYSAHEKSDMALLANRNSLAPTYLDEMSRIAQNFAYAADADFPADLPLLLFVEADNAANPDWLGLHERQAATVEVSEVIPVDGEHYLHHTHGPEIAAQMARFLG